MNTRSELTAGTMKAGDKLSTAPAVELLAEVKTLDECEALQPILQARAAAARVAREAHGSADPLADDATLDAHAAKAAGLDRELTRAQAAVDRLASLRADLVAADALASEAATVAAAREAAAEAERLTCDYQHHGREIAAILARLAELRPTIEAGRRIAKARGESVSEVGLLLPHERRSDLTRDRPHAAPDLVNTAMHLPSANGDRDFVYQSHRR